MTVLVPAQGSTSLTHDLQRDSPLVDGCFLRSLIDLTPLSSYYDVKRLLWLHTLSTPTVGCVLEQLPYGSWDNKVNVWISISRSNQINTFDSIALSWRQRSSSLWQHVRLRELLLYRCTILSHCQRESTCSDRVRDGSDHGREETSLILFSWVKSEAELKVDVVISWRQLGNFTSETNHCSTVWCLYE